jgi:hypothetical protein
MKDITYNKLNKIRSTRYFNDMELDDKETALLYLGEELVEKIKRIDSWMSDENGFEGKKFDTDSIEHARLFAKLDMLNDELMNIIEKTELDCVEIH